MDQSIETVYAINEQEIMNAVLQDDTDSFKDFVDNHVRYNTKFSSAEDLIKNSKPWKFVWNIVGFISCVVIPFSAVDILSTVLILGGFSYAAVFVVSGIIRKKYANKFSGEFGQEINIAEFLAFLDGHLKMVSPCFHECGYLSERGELLTSIGNVPSKSLKNAKLYCECGAKRKCLATICIKPDVRKQNSGKMQYFVGEAHKGFLTDEWVGGFLGHACLIRTAPILQAAMLYYLKIIQNRHLSELVKK